MAANQGLGTSLDDLRVSHIPAFAEAVAAGHAHRCPRPHDGRLPAPAGGAAPGRDR